MARARHELEDQVGGLVTRRTRWGRRRPAPVSALPALPPLPAPGAVAIKAGRATDGSEVRQVA